jgi:diguanylate cyclase (GGDEF)-like protein
MEESSRVQSLGHKDAIFPPSRYRRGGAGFGSTERRVKAQAATARAANGDHDALTGLPVLASLAGMFRCLLRWARRSDHALALVSFNIDEFRSVCEAYGREEGDKTISTVASIMRAEVDPSAIVVRAGTSKFIVVLTELTDATGAIEPVQRILDAIARPRDVGGQDLRITASAGVAIFPDDGDDCETLQARRGPRWCSIDR